MEGVPWRFAAVLVLLAVLVGLFVWAGTVQPASTAETYPDTEAVHQNPEQYVGERVTIVGTVVDTDPLTVETEPVPGETRTFVVENYDGTAAVGEYYRIFGTLQSSSHIDASATIDSEPWEMYYMYVVSVLGGLWVLTRLVNGWTVDTTTWSLVPRTEPLLTLRI